MKRYNSIIERLYEDIRLSDLKGHAGISNLTQPFMKDRRKLKGQNTASLIDCIINKQENWIEFQFRSGVTYPSEEPHKKVNKDTLELKKNPSKVYLQYIRIMEFFDWLNTAPDLTEVDRKDIKEILEVSNIKVFCTCPMFQYQGPNWKISSEFDGSIYPTDIPDPVWGPRHNDDALVCKHIDLILSQIEFWYNPLASTLTKKLKERSFLL